MRLPLLCAAAITVLPALALPFAPAASLATPAADAAPIVNPAPPPEPPAAVVPSAPAPDSAPALVGTYECQGVEPDGTPYKGLVQIIPNRGSYDVIWIFASGQLYSGLGVVNGDVLAVSYFTNRPGVVAYKIENGEKGPRLQGQWTVIGAGKVFQETLTRMTEDVKPLEVLPQPQRRPAAPLLRHSRPA